MKKTYWQVLVERKKIEEKKKHVTDYSPCTISRLEINWMSSGNYPVAEQNQDLDKPLVHTTLKSFSSSVSWGPNHSDLPKHYF